jgi:phage baseplate assembly protein W
MTALSIIDIMPRQTPRLARLARWQGLSRGDARSIGGTDHLRQSIIDILTTYPGERIMRPEYGSRLRDLIDRPVNAQWLADLYFEVAYAIARWEPRVRVQRVRASLPNPGHVELDLLLRIGDHEQKFFIQVPL